MKLPSCSLLPQMESLPTQGSTLEMNEWINEWNSWLICLPALAQFVANNNVCCNTMNTGFSEPTLIWMQLPLKNIQSVNKHLLNMYYAPGICKQTRSFQMWLSAKISALRENNREALFQREWSGSPLELTQSWPAKPQKGWLDLGLRRVLGSDWSWGRDSGQSQVMWLTVVWRGGAQPHKDRCHRGGLQLGWNSWSSKL